MPTVRLEPEIISSSKEVLGIPWPAPNTQLTLTGLLDDADVADPTKSLTLSIVTSADGKTYVPGSRPSAWVGGQINHAGGPLLPLVGQGYTDTGVLPAFYGFRIETPIVGLSVGVEETAAP